MILFAGLCTVDLVQRVDDFPAHGTKIRANSMELAAGGPATNAAITAAALGAEVVLVTALGAHPLASVAREELGRFGVRLVDLAAQRLDPPTISSVVVSDVDGARTVVSRNAEDLELAGTDEVRALVDAADAVLLDGHHPAVALDIARRAACPVVLDAGSRKPVTEKLLRYLTICACSADFGAPEEMPGLVAAGAELVTRTDGAAPVRWWTRADSGAVAVPEVRVRDTLGAGDVWHGALVHAVTQGKGFAEAIAAANEVAARRVQASGARTWLEELCR